MKKTDIRTPSNGGEKAADSISLLEKINSPEDVKSLNGDQIEELVIELRRVIIDTVSENGGHLASNLGMVEASVALHRVFDSPRDSLVFDVGHQCYAHKLLTGRYGQFSTLRKYRGLSGFTNPRESEHDPLFEGHSGTSVSAALGIARANKLRGDDGYAVAVVGDGSLTNGMIYEALNNCADEKLNLIILINDNEMSISRNIGGLHKYLSRIRTSKGYFTFKRGFERWLSRIPLVGYPTAKFFKRIKDAFKHIFVPDTIFEDLGLVYLGPVNGNDIKKLSAVLCEAKLKHQCCVVHMITRKGLGYREAEDRPDKYHSVGKLDTEGSAAAGSGRTLSCSFGDALCEIAAGDSSVCAITAAMCDGTGLKRFSKEYPERFFDVGIAEEHAVTFASGLAVRGMKPVVALYSTFAQRVCDQLIHDISLQGLPMVLALDRCGIVPGDGVTHQGIFDYALFSSVPGVKIYSCADGNDINDILHLAVAENGLSVVRYPKGNSLASATEELIRDGLISYTDSLTDGDVVIITHGRMTDTAVAVRNRLADCSIGVIKLHRVYPLDFEKLSALCAGCRLAYVLDEGSRVGGLGEKLAAGLAGSIGAKIFVRAVDGFVEHGDLPELFELCGFSEDRICQEISGLWREIQEIGGEKK